MELCPCPSSGYALYEAKPALVKSKPQIDKKEGNSDGCLMPFSATYLRLIFYLLFFLCKIAETSDFYLLFFLCKIAETVCASYHDYPSSRPVGQNFYNLFGKYGTWLNG